MSELPSELFKFILQPNSWYTSDRVAWGRPASSYITDLVKSSTEQYCDNTDTILSHNEL